MAGSGLSGQSGYMPIDMYLRKNEVTLMHSPEEDYEQINNYRRQALIDYRDAPTQFEQDAQRYDNHSRERLSLRHNGDRSQGVVPWLPDDTFMDQAFLADIGNRDLPNFQDLRSQIAMRVRNIPLYTDDDPSIPSKEKSAYEHIRDKDRLFNRAKDTFKIFDTSFDYLPFGNTVGQPLLGSKQLKKLIHDQVPSFMSEEAATNRNWQIELSNRMPVGWHTTPDNVFKVARYDSPRKMADMKTDSYQNKIAGKLDTDFLVSFEGKNIPRSLALTLMDIMRQRKQLECFMKSNGTQYGDSAQISNRKIKELNNNIVELMRRYSTQSSTASANQLLNSEGTNVSGKRYMQRSDPNKIKKSIVSLQLFDVIKQDTNNRKLGKQDFDDLRDQIAQTATTDAIYGEAKNMTSGSFTANANENLWQSLAEHKRDEQMAIFNYAGVHPGKRGQMAGSHDMFDVTEYDRLVHPDIANKKIITNKTMYEPDVLEYEDINEREAHMWNIGGTVQTKSDRQMTDSDYYAGEVQNMSELTNTYLIKPNRIRSVR